MAEQARRYSMYRRHHIAGSPLAVFNIRAVIQALLSSPGCCATARTGQLRRSDLSHSPIPTWYLRNPTWYFGNPTCTLKNATCRIYLNTTSHLFKYHVGLIKYHVVLIKYHVGLKNATRKCDVGFKMASVTPVMTPSKSYHLLDGPTSAK